MPRKQPVAVPPGGGPLDREIKTRIDRELHRQVQEAAAREDRSEAAIVRRALRQYLGNAEDDRARQLIQEGRRP